MGLKELAHDLTPPIIWGAAKRVFNGRQSSPSGELRLNETRRLFVQWNAERLGISFAESLRRYQESWQTISGGHAGTEFRDFDTQFCEFVQVLYPDSASHVIEAYRACAPLMFLRLLSYDDPAWKLDDPVVRALPDGPVILDFGCGLAQDSRALASLLASNESRPTLYLADIPTDRKDFLLWIGQQRGIPTTFLDCTAADPIPRLPSCNIIFAQEFFEHVHEPTKYMTAFDLALVHGGFLVTNVADHHPEYMHVRPDLGELRALIQSLGYDELELNTLFRKP